MPELGAGAQAPWQTSRSFLAGNLSVGVRQ
jgi:hypothetical protein